jgi:glycerol-3-phosphate dehydrogenase
VLAPRHGGEARLVADLVAADPTLGEPLVEGTDYLRAEAVHAARHEMACSLVDVLARRTRALLQARDASVAAAPQVAALVAPELGWDEAEAARQVEAYRAVAEREAASYLEPA